MAIIVDDSQMPFLFVSFEGKSSDAQFDRYAADLEKAITNYDAPHGTIVDVRTCAMPSVYGVKVITTLARERTDLLEHLVGSVFVVTAPMVRGLLKTMFTVANISSGPDNVVVATLEEAVEWLGGEFSRREIPFDPPRLDGTASTPAA